MAYAFLKFAFPANTNRLIITWAKHSSPLAEIGRTVYQPPHPERGVTIQPLDPVMHVFNFWESVNGSSLDTLRLTLNIDLTSGSLETIIYAWVVGRSVNDPDDLFPTTFTDPRLVGTQWHLEKRGVGKMIKGTEYEIDSTLGKTTLLNGEEFVEGDTFHAVVQKLAQPLAAAGEYEILIVDTAIAFDSSFYNKLVIADMPAGTHAITFPPFNAIPKTKVFFSTHVGEQRYLKLIFLNSVWFLGKTTDTIWLGKGEELELYFTGTQCFVKSYEGDARRLGDVCWHRKAELNTLPLDGKKYLIADYERLYHKFINKLPVSQVCTLAEWAALTTEADGRTEYYRKGLFGVSATEFIVPDLRNRFVRALKLPDTGTDPGRTIDVPGGFQYPDAKVEILDTGGDDGTNLNAIPTNLGYQSDSQARKQFYKRKATFGTETRPGNVGLIPSIII